MIKLIKLMFFIIKNFLLKKNFRNKNTAKNIRSIIEKLGPIFIKLGQILSTRTDIIPSEIAIELTKLQTHVQHYDFNKIKIIIEKNLKKNINDLFKKVNENPLASASIAQLHTAILKNEKKVLIKIIKPHVKKKIKRDILILKCIAKLSHILFKKIRRLKPIDVIKELERSLKKEINLENEAVNIIKIKNETKQTNTIYIPNININIVTQDVLVIEYIDGINILNKKKLIKSSIKTKIIITNLLNFFYMQAFKNNLFHADLHPGNILISKNSFNDPVIILIDFGISSSLKKKEKIYLAKNLLAFAQRKYKKIINLHIKAKTIKTKKNIKDIENDLYLIFEPILNKKIKNISFRKTITSLLKLSAKINMQVQPNFILFQKTILSIESISRKISPSTNLWKITRQAIEKIIIENIIKKNLKIKKSKKYKILIKKKQKITYITLIIVAITNCLIIIKLIDYIIKYKSLLII